ncbi:MAG TPA: hypothetical protein VF409_00785 [Sphingomonas sp.]
MTHEPPVPPDNQSPYPIAQPPHEHHAAPPALESEPVSEHSSGPPRMLLIGGAIAAAGVAAIGGLAAFLLRRGKLRSKTAPKAKRKR